MRKGQVEFIIVLGIIFIISIVGYYAFQSGVFNPSLAPVSVRNQQELVSNMVNDIVRQGVDETLRVMETHGGYLTIDILENQSYTDVEGVVFLGGGVPYWQMCENDLSPERSQITDWFELGIKIYIENHINEIKEMFGKNVSFNLSELSVSADILNPPYDRIDVSVFLPTSVQGYPMQQPYYTISVPTKFGYILDFAKDYSRESASERFMEVFTIASIYLSWNLPTVGILTQCGETIYLTPDELAYHLQEVVIYTITHILWWQPMPVDPTATKTYSIESVNGRAYRDLDIEFFLPDGFKLESPDHILLTNNAIVFSAMSPFKIPQCISAYDQKYSVDYPVIIRVYDWLSGYSFNFASEVFVDNMDPGRCGDIGPPGVAHCGDLLCSARIKVEDGLGNIIEGAQVLFGDCLVGYTGPDGVAEGQISCSVENLSIYYKPSEYSFFNQPRVANNVNGTYVIHRKPKLTMNLYRVYIDSHFVPGVFPPYIYHVCSVGEAEHYLLGNFISNPDEYTITNIDPDSVPPSCGQGENCENCFGGDTIDCEGSSERAECQERVNDCRACSQQCLSNVLNPITVDYIPAGTYTMDMELLNQHTLRISGGSRSTQDVPELDSTWYVHIPSRGELSSISDSDKEELASYMRSACGINPVENVQQPGKIINMASGCSCEDLEGVLRNEISDCPEYNSIMSKFCTGPIWGSYPSDCGYCMVNCETLCDKSAVVSMSESLCDTRIRGCS